MKLLFVIPSFHPANVYGGPIYSTFELSRALARQGHELRVLTTDANGAATLDVETSRPTMRDALHVRYCHRIAFDSVAPDLLGALWTQVAWADVVHLTAAYSFPIPPTLLVCKAQHKPLVWSPRGAFMAWPGSSRRAAKRIWNLVCRRLVPRRLVFHATSRREAEATVAVYPGRETAVVPNGVDLAAPDPPPPPNGRLQLLYLGRLHPIKGLEVLLEGCRVLREQGVPWRLTIAGGGEQGYVSTLTRKIDALDLAGEVSMVGPVFGDAKRELFRRSHVVLAPSHSENFGVVVAEALAHGRPVIASHGTPWEGLEERGCGFWIENSPEAIAVAVRKIGRLDIAAMGARGREWMEQEFSWSKVAQQIASVYRSLLE